MKEFPYRTGKTWLSDADLTLLDVMFRGRVSFRLLREQSFKAQWNLGYSHGLNDAELRSKLAELQESGVIATTTRVRTPTGEDCFGLTSLGGDLWCEERCPIWERYCTTRYNDTLRGTTLCTVVAVSPEIRDDFLRDYPISEAKTRCRTIEDYELLYWRPSLQVYAGTAAYFESSSWTASEYREHARHEYNHNTYVEQERTWWSHLSELQRFIRNPT